MNELFDVLSVFDAGQVRSIADMHDTKQFCLLSRNNKECRYSGGNQAINLELPPLLYVLQRLDTVNVLTQTRNGHVL
jgi:hypothetical protein